MLRWLGQEAGREFDAGRGFLWLPVAVGMGIAIYFGLPDEPPLVLVLALPPVCAGTAAIAVNRPLIFRTLVMLFCVTLGMTAATVRTLVAHSPTVPREMTLDLTGWIAWIEDAPSRGRRIYLRIGAIEGWGDAPIPRNVRVTVSTADAPLDIGAPVRATTRLIPPSGPVYPGGYDFARHAYYGGYDAVGFTYGAPSPAPELGPAPLDIRLKTPLARLRDGIRARIEAALPGDTGEVAAALVTGDRGGITNGTQEAMRASGLGHVLAISGLHMALVAGTAFWVIRAALALVPNLALTRPIKKWAAGGALGVAAFYLAISGAGIATQRAFIMFAIMLLAVLLDRRAITLRNVALAALAILVMTPESLLTASFQMSFAATAALVAAYEAWQDRPRLPDVRPNVVLVFVFGLAFSSLVAGFATTPFALFHFQRIAPLNLLANMLAMPAVTLIVMPAALLSVVLMPFGLEWAPLQIMGLGLEWVTGVAAWVSGLSGESGYLPQAGALALPVFSVGFAWLLIWRRVWRVAGFIPMLAAAAFAFATPRPFLLVDADASVVAVRGDDGRYRMLRKGRESFIAAAMLRSDGDARPVTARTLGEGTRCDDLGCTLVTTRGVVAFATTHMALLEDCLAADIVVSRYPAPHGCSAPALVIDRDHLDTRGAHAVHATPDGLRIDTAYPDRRRRFSAR